MFYPALTAIVTLVSLILYFLLIAKVGKIRGQNNISGTVTNLPEELAVAQRIQINTTEQLVLFLPLLWMAASLTSDGYAAIIGAVWVIGRIVYVAGYTKSFAKRGPGIAINMLANLFLLGGIIWGLVQYFRFTSVTMPSAGM